MKNTILIRNTILLLTFIIFPFFFVSDPSYQSTRSFKELWNLGHVLFFAVFVILLYFYLFPKYVSSTKKICLCLVAVILTGSGIELAQLGIHGRTVGLDDILRDLAGGAIVLGWRCGDSQLPVLQRIPARTMAFLIAVTCVFPLGFVLVDEYRARVDFPVLSNFESRSELSRWEHAENMRWASHPVRRGRYSAEVRLTSDKYSGISLSHFPEDWHDKKALAFSIYNPGSPLELNYRVHDRLHTGTRPRYQDRFNGMCILAGGWNEVIIPMEKIRNAPVGRQMDLSHIRGFGLFVIQQFENRIFYLDDVRLLE